MVSKRKVLFLRTSQFGYHIDSYMYCKYLDKSKFDVYYFCFNVNKPIVQIEDVNVEYVKFDGNKFKSYTLFFRKLRQFVSINNFDIIFHIDAKFTLLIRLLCFNKPMVLDIRTGNLSDNKLTNAYKNFGITFSALFYKRVSVISEGLREKLKISFSKTTIIPLGGEFIETEPKTFNSLRILYLGTLTKRNIHETIEGLAIFINNCTPEFSISYDIVGEGSSDAVSTIKKTIKQNGLSEIVHLHGRKNREELSVFFQKCNLGLVYVPIKSYYQFQPSTKLFEYALAGMPVIATQTHENMQLMTSKLGVLTVDNPTCFAGSLNVFWSQRYNYASSALKDQLLKYEWSKIVKNILEPYLLESILRKNN